VPSARHLGPRRSGVAARRPRAGEAEAAEPKSQSVEDLLIPLIPSLITSLVLEGFADLEGLQKIGAGVSLGLVLWVLTWHHRGGRLQVSAVGRRRWTVALLVMVLLAVLALVLTVVVYHRPTPTTATVTLVALAVLGAVALAGRRLAGAAAAAICGGLIGLCVGIALL
jgi:hypothetical protein